MAGFLTPLLAGAVLILADGACPAGEAPANLVANGDFSAVRDGRPAGWEASGDPKTVDLALEAASDGGNPCARLVCTRCDGAGGWTHAMLLQMGVAVEAGRTYEFTCRARAEGLAGRTVAAAISDTAGWHPCGFETDLVVTPSWASYRRLFKASRSAGRSARLQIWYTEPGTLYIDDVRIVPVDAGRIEFATALPDVGAKNLVPN